jgi:hypothetical protein
MVSLDEGSGDRWFEWRIGFSEGLRWSIALDRKAFTVLQAEAFSGESGPSVHTAREVATLIDKGEYTRAVSELGWVLKERDLLDLAEAAPSSQRLNLSSLLTQIFYQLDSLNLSNEQRAVANMLYAVKVLGLDSDYHPSERATALLEPHRGNFPAKLSGYLSHHPPLPGAASLLAAQGSECEHSQPLGVLVLKEAAELRIPAILVTTNHTLGGDSVFVVADYLAKHNILAGKVDSGDLWVGSSASDGDVLWESRKDNIDVWKKAFTRLAAKGLHGPSKTILVVEDCHSGNDHPDNPEVVCAPIKAAFADCPELGGYSLVFARDAGEGIDILHKDQIAGVISDLFMPMETASRSKIIGDTLVEKILAPYLTAGTVTNLLTTIRNIESAVGKIVRSEFEKLLATPS